MVRLHNFGPGQWPHQRSWTGRYVLCGFFICQFITTCWQHRIGTSILFHGQGLALRGKKHKIQRWEKSYGTGWKSKWRMCKGTCLRAWILCLIISLYHFSFVCNRLFLYFNLLFGSSDKSGLLHVCDTMITALYHRPVTRHHLGGITSGPKGLPTKTVPISNYHHSELDRHHVRGRD